MEFAEYDQLAGKHRSVLKDKDLMKHDEYRNTKDLESLTFTPSKPHNATPTRDKWGNSIEFLMSCIALSVGLGNVWRFPFIALQNGGGAFVIPYIVVLLLVGKPIYYMEVLLGQFSSRACVKAFDVVPMMRGIAYGQVYATGLATTYYASIMAITLKFLISSFQSVLPWANCREEWGSQCVDSSTKQFANASAGEHGVSSADIYFTKTVLAEVENLDNGIGMPRPELVACLAVTWIIISVILIKGIRSSGKASYFLALFPYGVMFILFIRAVTLPGSMDGIIYFLKPQWDQLLNPQVWYAAITQMFFSLAICFGTLIMYASYNDFRKNVYKDVLIITTIDSFTSIFAGCIIFGILGNLAHETRSADIASVVKAGAGLAFISYPEAIARFDYMPHAFAVLFFFMLLVLGIGSNVGMASCVITVIKDRFQHLPHWLLAAAISCVGFAIGVVYMAPGGQFILNLVDFFGCSFIGLVLAIAELVAVGWVYGVKRFCRDIEFMLGVKTGIYWRICWAVVTPGLMLVVLVYTLLQYEPLTYKDIAYPTTAYGVGWSIWAVGVLQLPLWAVYAVWKQKGASLKEKITSALQPAPSWGPLEPKLRREYATFVAEESSKEETHTSLWHKIKDNIFG